MTKFNREKALRQLEFKRKWRSYSRYVYMAVPCVLCCLLCLYFAYSKFFVSEEQVVIRTTVGDFIYGDVVIGAYIDGQYSSTIPGKNDGYAVEKVACDNGAVGEWNNDDWGLLTTNISKRSKCNIYFITKLPTVAEKITELAQSDTVNFASDDPDNNVRYIGANPDNYIYFNCSDYNNQSDSTCEKWRIIGLFNNITKSDGTKENLIKIIRDDSIGKFYFDYKKTGVGSSTEDWGSNDWTDSQLMMMLNPTGYLKNGYINSNDIISYNGQQLYSKMGSYYNSTKGCKPSEITKGENFNCVEIDFTTTGLKQDTRNAIESVVWNLGGVSMDDSSHLLFSQWYSYERGTNTYGNAPTTWTGMIGLMYPSDFGYATSGGSTKNRSACLNDNGSPWANPAFIDCLNNNFLYKPSKDYEYEYVLTPTSNSKIAYATYSNRFFAPYSNCSNLSIRPTLFLKSNISISGGIGSSSDPYQLSIK